VSIGPLTRLRLAFIGLGVVLLAPLGFLLAAVDERVEAQRRLRHDVVAERIFDELERELTALLAAESARPSTAYDEPTRVDAWAPFVVGYFKASPHGVELLAADQLDAPRAERLREVLGTMADDRARPRPVPAMAGARETPAVSGATDLSLDDSLGLFDMKTGPELTRKKSFPPRSSPDVLQKLNRSQEERVRSSSPPVRSRPKGEDPMQRY
jgi:hypothetical protein